MHFACRSSRISIPEKQTLAAEHCLRPDKGHDAVGRMPGRRSGCPSFAYGVNGKQYVAVVVGNGNAHESSWVPLFPEIHIPRIMARQLGCSTSQIRTLRGRKFRAEPKE